MTSIIIIAVQLIIGLLLAGVWPALASSPLPARAEQVLFIVDDSGSMSERAGAQDDPQASRWQMIQKSYPQWLARLGSNVLVGGISLGGGACGAPPAIKLSVGTDRQQLAAAIAAARPRGQTNLNAVLQSAPGLFASEVRGTKRIVLLSDGLNTCPPAGAICDMARQLHRDHGVVIDVVAWLTEPGMRDAFRCVTQVSGGSFTVPRTLKELLTIPLPELDPRRYVVLALSFVTLLLAARILYRHGHHVWGWSPRRATLAGGLLFTLGILSVYVVLFAGADPVVALLGLAALIGLFLMAWRYQASPPAPDSSGLSPWVLVLVLVGSLMLPQLSFAVETLPASCARVVHGAASYHHVLALDMSGSVARHLSAMKKLLACYAGMYILPQEEISLVVFGYDHTGMAKEIRTFSVPPEGPTAILHALLHDLEMHDPKSTRTYFRPLADNLQQLLQRVRLQPVVLVVSDGQSDAYTDARRGLVQFQELPFESFGQRGVYSAPGMYGWQVAIAGGNGLDLTALFQKPVTRVRMPQTLSSAPGAVFERCVLDPELLVTTEERVVLRPRWNPFARVVESALTLQVRHECVARFRSFAVELRLGEETLTLGRVTQTMIDQNPRLFTLPIAHPQRGAPVEATLLVILDQGGSTRVIYPQPAAVMIEEVSYWSVFGLYWVTLSTVLLLVSGLTAFGIRQRRIQEYNRPEVVKVLGGPGVPLGRDQAVTIGDGSPLTVPDVAPGVVLGIATWTGVRGALTLRPADGFQLKVNGVDVDGSTTYRLGQLLQFVSLADGATHHVTLYAGSTRAIGFSAAPFAAGHGSPLAGGIPSFGGMGLSAEHAGFGPMPGTVDGHGSNTSVYI